MKTVDKLDKLKTLLVMSTDANKEHPHTSAQVAILEMIENAIHDIRLNQRYFVILETIVKYYQFAIKNNLSEQRDSFILALKEIIDTTTVERNKEFQFFQLADLAHLSELANQQKMELTDKNTIINEQENQLQSFKEVEEERDKFFHRYVDEKNKNKKLQSQLVEVENKSTASEAGLSSYKEALSCSLNRNKELEIQNSNVEDLIFQLEQKSLNLENQLAYAEKDKDHQLNSIKEEYSNSLNEATEAILGQKLAEMRLREVEFKLEQTQLQLAKQQSQTVKLQSQVTLLKNLLSKLISLVYPLCNDRIKNWIDNNINQKSVVPNTTQKEVKSVTRLPVCHIHAQQPPAIPPRRSQYVDSEYIQRPTPRQS